MIRQAFFALLATTSPLLALDLSVPRGVETRAEVSAAASVRLPISAWSAEIAPPEIEGAIRRRALRIGVGGQTTLQLLQPLRDTLAAAGYEEIFTCVAQVCGGFDFRFQLDLLGEPDMHVDLGDFRYLLAQHPNPAPDMPNAVSIVASRTAQAGYVHITEVFPVDMTPQETAIGLASALTVASSDLASTLEQSGHAVLNDLDFGSGEAELSASSYDSLAKLATWLQSNPTVIVSIVGHTDAVGSLASNTALSRQRAESVLAQLRDVYGVDAQQMQADGAGYLAPVASNLTETGRAANRRVEVILLSDGS